MPAEPFQVVSEFVVVVARVGLVTTVVARTSCAEAVGARAKAKAKVEAMASVFMVAFSRVVEV